MGRGLTTPDREPTRQRGDRGEPADAPRRHEGRDDAGDRAERQDHEQRRDGQVVCPHPLVTDRFVRRDRGQECSRSGDDARAGSRRRRGRTPGQAGTGECRTGHRPRQRAARGREPDGGPLPRTRPRPPGPPRSTRRGSPARRRRAPGSRPVRTRWLCRPLGWSTASLGIIATPWPARVCTRERVSCVPSGGRSSSHSRGAFGAAGFRGERTTVASVVASDQVSGFTRPTT